MSTFHTHYYIHRPENFYYWNILANIQFISHVKKIHALNLRKKYYYFK